MKIWCVYYEHDGPEDSAFFSSKEKAVRFFEDDILSELSERHKEEWEEKKWSFLRSDGYNWLSCGGYIIYELEVR